MKDVAGRRVGQARAIDHPGVHRILLARIEVIEPRREQSPAAQLAPIFVRDGVVGIVVARPFVPERTEQVPRKPRGRLHPDERTALGRFDEHAVESLLVERVLLTAVVLVT